MAGLLDFNDPETRMGLGLLALSQMPRSQGFQGLLGLLAQEGQAKQKEMQRQVNSGVHKIGLGRQDRRWQTRLMFHHRHLK